MTRYFELLDPQFRKVSAIFRIRTGPSGLYVERYDPEAAAWTEGPGTLLRFVNEGEVGAQEISRRQAEDFIALEILPPLPVPV